MKKLLALLPVLFFTTTCTKDHFGGPEKSDYPENIAKIIVPKCANAGCHNTQSASVSNGLDFSTWGNMFKGGKNGSSVIPYAVDESYTLYFVNTDTSLGLVGEPTMPLNMAPLSKAEYLTLRNWIANGAPNKDGFVKFSDNPNRKKIYVCMSGCDKVAVFDAESKVIMRYISVGVDAQIETPHQIRITPDGKYWAVVFFSGHVVQFFNTSDDSHVADIEIGSGSWNSIAFLHNSPKAFLSDLGGNKIQRIDFSTFSKEIFLGYPSPHGLYITKDDQFLYATSQLGNRIYKIHLDDYSDDPINVGGNPHEIVFTEDESKYFVSCQASNEVKVFRASDDMLDTVLSVGPVPQEFAFSKNHPYLFVTCMNELNSINTGFVYIIDYQTNSIIKSFPTNSHPHGVAADDDQDLMYIGNININVISGSAHHPSSCNGANGFISIIDLKTLQELKVNLPDGTSYTYRNEVLPSPYFVTYRK